MCECSQRYGPEIVRALLDKGADSSIGNIFKNNMTPFEVAAFNKLDEICLIFDPSGLKPRRSLELSSGGTREEQFTYYERTHQLDRR
jgi:hypothetical protein